jgi:glycosyltransferase involved in cell wall biosynthesis
MSAKFYPKVLVFSQSFNNFSGGGITLTNLFLGWPKERIAVVTYNYMLVGISTDICDTYYQLGQEEIHWIFPFSLVRGKNQSGLLDEANISIISITKKGTLIKQKSSGYFLNLLIKWAGLDHVQSGISISERLNAWLKEYRPELLYFQISNRESINFARDLIESLRIPSVLHMMDDWPTTISTNSLAKRYWKNRIDKEFKQLLKKTDLRFSICDEMSNEYKKRYGWDFYPFHNTLDIDKWTPFIRNSLRTSQGTKTVLFSGRIGKGIERSLFDLATAVDKLLSEGIDVCLQIQSPRSIPGILDGLSRYKSVKINSSVDYDKLPEIYSKADILVIANDFSQEGINFLRFSMPTKAPEYMISGTPILVYASSETALFKLFHNNQCGHCVANQSSDELAYAISLLLKDINYREQLSRNAVNYALEHFDSKKVRPDFQNLLIETSKDI